jgi:uncharacterized OB-fold protein
MQPPELSEQVSDAELFDRFPGIQLDHVNKHFYRGILDGELRLSRCDDCGHWHYLPKPRCPACLSANLTPTAIQGTGTIYLLTFEPPGRVASTDQDETLTNTGHLGGGRVADGSDPTRPRPIVTVELDEQAGLRFSGALIGTDADDVAIGDRVELDWITRAGHPYPVWRKTATRSGSPS